MVNYCCITNCKNRSDMDLRPQRLPYKFFSIPKNPAKRSQWLNLIGQANLLSATSVQIDYKRICDVHFLPEMMTGMGLSRLKPDAFPCIFNNKKGFNEESTEQNSLLRHLKQDKPKKPKKEKYLDKYNIKTSLPSKSSKNELKSAEKSYFTYDDSEITFHASDIQDDSELALGSVCNPISLVDIDGKEIPFIILNIEDDVVSSQPAIRAYEKQKICRICLSTAEGDVFSIAEKELQIKIQCLYALFHVSITEYPICCQECKNKIDEACDTIQLIKKNDSLLCDKAKNIQGLVELHNLDQIIIKQEAANELVTKNIDSFKITDINDAIDTNDINNDINELPDIADDNCKKETSEIEIDWETYDYGNNIDELPDIWYDEFKKKKHKPEIETVAAENPDHDYTTIKTNASVPKIIGYRKLNCYPRPSIPIPHLDNGIFSEPFNNYLDKSKVGFGAKLVRHIRMVVRKYDYYGTGPYLCHICGFSITSKLKFKLHLQNKHSTRKDLFLCPHCGLSFSSNSTLKIHKQNKHMVSIKKFKCQQCSKMFKHKKSFDMHMEFHKDPSERNVFSCKYCGKEFYFKVYRDRHLRVHTGEKKFQCHICNMEFWYQYYLKKHMKKRHEYQGDPISCPTCNHNFKNPTSLHTHINIVHNNIGRYKCKHCEKCYYKKDTLQRHLINKHNIDVKRYQCDLCPNMYFSEIGFKEHKLRKHWNNSKKPENTVKEKEEHTCEHCSRKFKTWDELIEHRVDEHTELFCDSDNDNNDVGVSNDFMDTADNDTEPEINNTVKKNFASTSSQSVKVISNYKINMPFL